MRVLNFEEIYHDYWKKIFRLCMGYVNDNDVAKDLCHETFLAVFQQLPKFRQEAAIGTWIYRIATNICLRQINIACRKMSCLIRSMIIPAGMIRLNRIT